MAVIYKIWNKANGKIYIGSTCDFSKRKGNHMYDLRRNIHPNPHMQRAWNKYGAENFIFKVIEECDECDKLKREQFYLDTLQLFGEKGYNIIKYVFARPPKSAKENYNSLCDVCLMNFSQSRPTRRYCLNDCPIMISIEDSIEEDEEFDAECQFSRYGYKSINNWDVEDHMAYEWDERMSK